MTKRRYTGWRYMIQMFDNGRWPTLHEWPKPHEQVLREWVAEGWVTSEEVERARFKDAVDAIGFAFTMESTLGIWHRVTAVRV